MIGLAALTDELELPEGGLAGYALRLLRGGAVSSRVAHGSREACAASRLLRRLGRAWPISFSARMAQ